VKAYEQCLKSMLPSNRISWDSLDNYLEGDAPTIRKHLVENWETKEALDKLDYAIKNDTGGKKKINILL
jgi:hypothetical protein